MNTSSTPEISIILPCYNEEQNVSKIAGEIKSSCRGLDYELLFVDDGSRDGTLREIEKLQSADDAIRRISFIKNQGHQTAIRAGIKSARGNYIITMDADLQHPPACLPVMVEKAREGYEVVTMIRDSKQSGFIKNLCSKYFYLFFNKISDTPIIPNSSDFRLMKRNVADILNALPERNLVLRIILPVLGFSTAHLHFTPGKRYSGSQSYTFARSFTLASQSIFNFTTFPLDIGFKLGLSISILAFMYGLIAIYARLFTDNYVPGYTDIIASVLFLGGIILIYLGILGKYMAVLIDHVKNRPEYIPKDNSGAS
ncbi:glycosyltransferase family 2 protein [Fibrobacterota bacterium]